MSGDGARECAPRSLGLRTVKFVTVVHYCYLGGEVIPQRNFTLCTSNAIL